MPRKAIGGVQRVPLNHYVPIPTGTGAVENITDWTPGFGFTVESVKAVVAVVGAGAGATRTFRVLKGASTVVASGTITLAGTTPVGVVIDLPVTAANAEFSDTDTLTVDWASGGTAFTAGALNLVIVLRQHPQKVR